MAAALTFFAGALRPGNWILFGTFLFCGRGVWGQIEDLHLGVKLVADCEVGKSYLKLFLIDTLCYSIIFLVARFPVISGSVNPPFSAVS